MPKLTLAKAGNMRMIEFIREIKGYAKNAKHPCDYKNLKELEQILKLGLDLTDRWIDEFNEAGGRVSKIHKYPRGPKAWRQHDNKAFWEKE